MRLLLSNAVGVFVVVLVRINPLFHHQFNHCRWFQFRTNWVRRSEERARAEKREDRRGRVGLRRGGKEKANTITISLRAYLELCTLLLSLSPLKAPVTSPPIIDEPSWFLDLICCGQTHIVSNWSWGPGTINTVDHNYLFSQRILTKPSASKVVHGVWMTTLYSAGSWLRHRLIVCKRRRLPWCAESAKKHVEDCFGLAPKKGILVGCRN